jgi:uncharacterized protein
MHFLFAWTKKKAKIKIMVLDIMKPHKPDIAEFGQFLCSQKTVQNVNISVYAIDEKTESIKTVLEGSEISLDEIRTAVEEFGAVIHSVDKVVVGAKKIIESPPVSEHIDTKK